MDDPTIGNLVTTTDPMGHTTLREYDTVGRLIKLTDPRGSVTEFTYEALNRVTEITDAQGGVTGFTYDANGNLLTVTDAENHTTTYTYDSMDRLATRTDALGRSEQYEYDPAGNLIRFTDRKGQVSTFTYDALNRRIRANYADGSNTMNSYDAVGRLVSVEDSVSGGIAFGHDSLDRLTQELTPQGVVNYAYDALHRRAAMTPNGQQPVTYAYDTASQLTQVAQGSQVVGLGYDAAGRRMALTYPNGTSTSYSYDAASRLTNLVHQGPAGVIDSLAYSYDAAGNRINLTRSSGTATTLPAAVQAAYDAANEQLQFNSSTPNLTYDANGNLTSQTDATGTTSYVWDARDRLKSMSGPGVTASFVYDALGRRISKTVNGVTTAYQYDYDDIIGEIGGGAVGVTYLRSLRLDEVFIRRGATTEFYHPDELGSILALTDGQGLVRTTYIYEAYGRTIGAGFPSSNPFQYRGRENDGTGLYYYRARYYSPRLQRFIREDPVGFAGGDTNLYGYVTGNPINRNDPFGLASLTTDMKNGKTTFDPEDGTPATTIDTRNDVTSKAKKGANAPFETPDAYCDFRDAKVRFGPEGAFIETGDKRGRDIHGGGTGLEEPFAQRQGWKPTLGCTRGQNEDLIDLCNEITDFRNRHPGVRIPYKRF